MLPYIPTAIAEYDTDFLKISYHLYANFPLIFFNLEGAVCESLSERVKNEIEIAILDRRFS